MSINLTSYEEEIIIRADINGMETKNNNIESQMARFFERSKQG